MPPLSLTCFPARVLRVSQRLVGWLFIGAAVAMLAACGGGSRFHGG
ncbi:MAG: hypothetical protein R3E68_00790 [Burkholderiaceae bacterium]